MAQLSDDEVEKRFGRSKANIESPANQAFHVKIRSKFVEMANWLDDNLPDGRAKSVMFTELETASMWAHKTANDA